MKRTKPKATKPIKQTFDDDAVSLQEKVAITKNFDFSQLTLKEAEDVVSLGLAYLKKVDDTLNDQLHRKVVSSIITDLDDRERCTPGLYQAALRLLGEDIALSGFSRTVSGSQVEELTKGLPEFK
jgi:hypothetical protein